MAGLLAVFAFFCIDIGCFIAGKQDGGQSKR